VGPRNFNLRFSNAADGGAEASHHPAGLCRSARAFLLANSLAGALGIFPGGRFQPDDFRANRRRCAKVAGLVGLSDSPSCRCSNFGPGSFGLTKRRYCGGLKIESKQRNGAAAASSLAGARREPVLAPWWLSPATAYWVNRWSPAARTRASPASSRERAFSSPPRRMTRGKFSAGMVCSGSWPTMENASPKIPLRSSECQRRSMRSVARWISRRRKCLHFCRLPGETASARPAKCEIYAKNRSFWRS
jgi:hypothetical protein